MTRWFRYYDDALNDPKILKLSDKLFRLWVGILCVSSKNGGQLPALDDLSLMVRIKPEKLEPMLKELEISGLLDNDGEVTKPHNWDGRQYKSDVSTERVKRFRNGKRNVAETPPDTEQNRTETEEDTASAVPTVIMVGEPLEIEKPVPPPSKVPKRTSGEYAFESGVIRLNESDFKCWELAFVNLDLRSELLSLTQWAEKQPKWFHAVASALAKRNREIGIKLKQARASPGGVRRHTVDDPMAGII
jgi:hypothetical protein